MLKIPLVQLRLAVKTEQLDNFAEGKLLSRIP